MGDPTRRSCDACEAMGSTSLKKIIKHLTCRRRLSTQLHTHHSADGKWLWTESFTRGYEEQTFRRICVRNELIHGESNERYLQRADHELLAKGKQGKGSAAASRCEPSAVCEAMHVPFVWTKEAALVVWS